MNDPRLSMGELYRAYRGLKKARMLHVNRYMCIGGVEFYILNMIRAFPDIEHTVVVKKNWLDGEMAKIYGEFGVTIRMVYGNPAVVSKMMINECGSYEYVIWHSSLWEPGDASKYNYEGALWVRVWHGNGYGIQREVHTNVAVSKDSIRQANRKGLTGELPICRGGIAVEDYRERNEQREGFVVGRYGSDRPEKYDVKNPEIFAGVKSEKTRYLIVGGESQREAFKKVGIDNVTTWVKASTTLKYEYLEKMDVAIYRNSKPIIEGFSIALLEMMAAGIVVVSEARGGNSEAIENGKSGFLVPWEDIEQFKQKLCWLRDNPEKRKEMSIAARERVRAMFSLKTLRDAWLPVLGW